MKKFIFRTMVITCALFTVGTPVDGLFGANIIVKDAEARIGRPLTPVSVAGVARRTTRRVIRRTAVFVPVLPVGCSVVVVDGMSLNRCGTTYYQASGNQYVVVVID